MKCMSRLMSFSFLWKLVCLMFLIAVPLWAQKKTSTPAPKSAPAPHASAPAHTSTPHNSTSTQHTTTPAHGNTSGTTNRTNTGTMGRSNTNTMGHSNTNTMGHSNTMNGRTGNATPARPGGSNNAGMKTGGANPGGNRANAMNSGHTAGAGRIGNRTVPGRQVSLRGGGTASLRPNGQIRSLNRNGMQISHGMHGGRMVVSTHNGVRVVSTGAHGGYVQRAYVVRGGHSYYSRTYYAHGVYRVGVYRGYYWGGRPYYGYHPAYFYGPRYYGWAYNPWPAPVYWGWGWGGAPWYGYWGAYYAPYPVYPSAAFWLADFMIAASLQASYEAQASVGWLGPDHGDGLLVASLVAPPAPDAQVKMSPEVKNAISEEVKATIAAEQADAATAKTSSGGAGGSQETKNEAPPALDPKFRTFLVSSDTSLVAGDDEECPLSQGDVIQRTTDTPDSDGNVNVKVVASAKKDCAIGKEGPMAVDDLQEMYNQFREQLKNGMGELAKKQGTGGLPKSPDTATTDGDVPAPPADKSAAKSLEDQQTAADQAEADVKQEAGTAAGGGGF